LAGLDGSFGRVLALIASLLWLVPRVRLEIRVASLAYFFAISYLSFIPYFPFPWYLPATTLLAFIALAGVVGQLWQLNREPLRWLLGTAGAVMIGAAAILTIGSARQARAQQIYIEDGNRRVIGEWLRDHAEPGDTVFMEPLGYIGFFSNLKTYDWPGMSSREVPATVRLLGSQWKHLILYLQPNWLVLRAGGEGDLPRISPILASGSYERVRDFDRRSEVEQLEVPGRDLLTFDAHFVLYRRRQPLRHDTGNYTIASPISSSIRTIHGEDLRMVHAPGFMITALPAEVQSVQVRYGFPDDAWEIAPVTNGAIFKIWLVDGKTRTKLHEHRLEPGLFPQHRGLHVALVNLPARRRPHQAQLVFETDAMGDNSKDWTFWSPPQFQ
jgi:hypothetical protein